MCKKKRNGRPPKNKKKPMGDEEGVAVISVRKVCERMIPFVRYPRAGVLEVKAVPNEMFIRVVRRSYTY